MDTLCAVNRQDLIQFGCPHCGGNNGQLFTSYESCVVWGCETCGRECIAVQNSLDETELMPFKNTDVRDLTSIHPRPSQHFPVSAQAVEIVRIGKCKTPGCFVDGGEYGCYSGIVLEAGSAQAASDVMRLFYRGAILDDRTVTIGASKNRTACLHTLARQIVKTRQISEDIIRQAIAVSFN